MKLQTANAAASNIGMKLVVRSEHIGMAFFSAGKGVVHE